MCIGNGMQDVGGLVAHNTDNAGKSDFYDSQNSGLSPSSYSESHPTYSPPP